MIQIGSGKRHSQTELWGRNHLGALHFVVVRYRHPKDNIEFEIADAWLAAAGVFGFVPTQPAFIATSDPKWPTILVPLSEVQAPRRNTGVIGLHEDRTVALLRAYVGGTAVPPLEVHTPPGQTQYSVRDGYHRYFTSFAIGFTMLPVSVRPYFDARLAPSQVVELNRAVAHAMTFGPAAGLEIVDALVSESSLRNYYLLPSVRGDLLAKLGRLDEARAEFERAAALTRNTR